MPESVDRALDIGCGLGLFSQRLATRAKLVDALDVDKDIIGQALRYNNSLNVQYIQADFLKADFPENFYDAIISIASLHHMDLEAALEKMKQLLSPSGTLVILGLYQERTLADHLYSIASIPINFVYLTRHRETAPMTVALTCRAQLSLSQIKEVANALMPGCSLKRHFLWRYSLIWRK